MECTALENYQFDTNYRQQLQPPQYRFNEMMLPNEVPPVVLKLTFKCDQCTITYSSRKRLDNHIEKHHTKKNLHKCPYCRSCFKRKVRLTNHFTKAHPEIFFGIANDQKQQQQLPQSRRQQHQQKQPINPQTKPSIFHSIELLAQSDSNDSSSSSLMWRI